MIGWMEAGVIGTFIFAGVSAAVLVCTIYYSHKSYELSKRSNHAYFNLERAAVIVKMKTYAFDKKLKIFDLSFSVDNEGGKLAYINSVQIGFIYKRYCYAKTVLPSEIQKKKIPVGASFSFVFESIASNKDGITVEPTDDKTQMMYDFPLSKRYRNRAYTLFNPCLFLKMQYINAEEDGDKEIEGYGGRDVIALQPTLVWSPVLSENIEKKVSRIYTWIKFSLGFKKQ